MFDFELSDELKITLRKLIRKDKKRVRIINKKIKEIIGNDEFSIHRYKNLKYSLKNQKRVHIDKHFVLTFDVDTQKNMILFISLKHHGKIY